MVVMYVYARENFSSDGFDGNFVIIEGHNYATKNQGFSCHSNTQGKMNTLALGTCFGYL